MGPHKILFIFLLILSNRIYSQNNADNVYVVSGIITDSNTGKPISGASIVVDYKKTGVISDSLGYYILRLPAYNQSGLPYLLKFDHISYKPHREKVFLRRNENIDVKLDEVSKMLEEVVVTSQGSLKNINTPSLGVSLLNLKSIKKLPAMMGEVDIIKSIQLLPGVSSVGEGSNGFNVRGGTVDQNLILIDEAPIFNPTHLFGLFSVFASDAIRDMELYKGSVPARFGGRAASVLNIKTTEPSLEKFKMNGGIGLISNRLMIETPIIKDKLSIMTAGRLSYNDFLFKLIDVPSVKNTRANFYDLSNKIFFRPNKNNTFSLSNYISKDYYRVDSLFGIANVIAKQTSFNYGHQNYSGTWSHFFGSKWSMNIIAVSANYNTNTFAPDSVNEIKLTNAVKYRNLKWNFDFNPNEKHKINFGISGTHYKISPGNLNESIISRIATVILPSEQSLEMAGYIDDEFLINKKWTIQAGLRIVQYLNLGPITARKYTEGFPVKSEFLENSINIKKGKSEKTYNGIEPRLAFKYSINSNTTLKFGYNRMQQFVHLISNNTTPLPTARWKTSDSFVKPQISDFLTVGLVKSLNENIFEFSAEAYFRNTKNLTDFVSGANLQLNTAIETQLLNGKGKAYGLEMMLTKKKGEVTGWFNYTYARSFQKINNEFSEIEQIANGNWYNTNYDKPHSLNFVFNTHPHPIHDIGFTFSYSTGRPFTSPSGVLKLGEKTYPVYESRNNDRLSAYHRLDFTWIMNNPSEKDRDWKGSWVFTVYNIYGRRNAYSVFFKSQTDRIKPYELSVFGSPIVSLGYNFKFR